MVADPTTLWSIRPPSSAQRSVVKWTATAFVGVVIVVGVLFVGLIDEGNAEVGANPLLGYLALFGIFLTCGALPFVPLRLTGAWYRLATALIGLAMLLGGFVLLILIVGIVVIPFGFVFFSAAFAPVEWSRSRILAVGVGLPLAYVGVVAVVAGVGSLIEAGRR